LAKTRFQQLQPKYEAQSHSQLIIFPHFPLATGLCFVAQKASRYRLIEDFGILLVIRLNVAGDLFLLLFQWRKAYSRYQLIGFPRSVICSGHSIHLDKPHILPSVAGTVFCNLKGKFPFNLKTKYRQLNTKGRPFQLI
jgi:hypothetical protein